MNKRIKTFYGFFRNKKSYLKALLFIPLLYNSFACEKSVDPKPVLQDTTKVDSVRGELSDGLLPLRVGYYWKYRNYYLNEDSSYRFEDIQDEYRITKSSIVTINNKSYTIFHRIWGYLNPETLVYQYASDEWFFRNFDDGVHIMGGKYNQDSIYTNINWYRYPVKKGETWKYPHLAYLPDKQVYAIYDTVTYTCTDTNAAFKTPIGTFKCAVYYHRQKLDEDVLEQRDVYDYYSQGVGWVGTVEYSYFEYTHERYPKKVRMLIATNVLNK